MKLKFEFNIVEPMFKKFTDEELNQIKHKVRTKMLESELELNGSQTFRVHVSETTDGEEPWTLLQNRSN